jgi:hypothetical protein
MVILDGVYLRLFFVIYKNAEKIELKSALFMPDFCASRNSPVAFSCVGKLLRGIPDVFMKKSLLQ